MSRKTTWILLTIPFLLWACTSDNRRVFPDADVLATVGDPFALGIGQTAAVGTSTSIVLVRFNGVFQDSRCPENVVCVVAGSATVAMTVQTTFEIRDVEIEVPPDGQGQAEVEEVTVTVLELVPPAREGQTINPLQYQVGVRVDETGSVRVPTS